ncbi:MAG: outer membrane lipoprotein carrier protein LolA [Deltaproteobacteria bacterium]|nr:outer membrane lipoprotein carrier protein LolA [Deltaproteobacteria bacterium]MBW2360229.1 outer membrane lipoprotein carrier protein LolA [Deltaproteobacteria bacterium]
MKPAILAAALLLALSAPASGVDESLPECAARAIAAVQARYEKVEDLSADFVQESRSMALGGGGLAARSQGHVVFAKPGRMRWTYTGPEESLVVSDGEWLWIFDPAAGEAQKLPVGDGALSGAAVQFLLGEGDVLDEFTVTELACGADEVRLELLPRAPATFEKLRIAVAPASGDMHETEVTDLFGNVTSVRFENIRVNTAPGPAVFRFEAPPGVEVIELERPPG